MKLRIKTLTPVHIGSGNKLEPIDYIIDRDIFYRISLDKALNALSDKVPEAANKFADWIERQVINFEEARVDYRRPVNKSTSKFRKEVNFTEFCSRELKDPKLKQLLFNVACIYKMEMPSGLQRKTQVDELLKSPDGLPLLPGTSLKGAIVTVLATNAWRTFTANERNNTLSRCKKERRNKPGEFDYPDENLISEVFCCKTAEGIRFDAARFSLTKFIHISDALPTKSNSDDLMEITPVNLYLKDKEPQSQTNAQETVKSDVEFEFDFTIDVEGLYKAFTISQDPNGKMWKGLDDKFQRLFGFSLKDVPKSEIEKKTFDALIKLLQRKSELSFVKELKWLDSLEYFSEQNGIKPSVIKAMKKFFTGYQGSAVSALRVGWASGFSSTTIFEELKETDKAFVEVMFKDKKIGIPRTSGVQYSTPNLNYFPKSKRLAAEEAHTPISNLGWVEVFDPEKGSVKPFETSVETIVQSVQVEDFTAKYTAENEKVKLKDSAVLIAVVTRSESPMVFCKILHPSLISEYSFKYPAGMEVGKFVKVKANLNKKGEPDGNLSFTGFPK